MKLSTTFVVVAAIATVGIPPYASASTSGDTFSVPTFSTWTTDVLGPNDVPGQKDLTAHATKLATDFHVAWKWDEIGLSGGNTGDACALFDVNGNENADAALCVTIANKPATMQSKRVYTCGDTKNDRCTSTYTERPPISVLSTCQVDNEAAPALSPGSGAFDTQATCKIALADFGASSPSQLLNTCSYPSREPTSAPSDCVLIPGVRETGAIEITKVGDDANCNVTTLPASCDSTGMSFLAGAHFSITGTGVPAGASDLVTTAGKVCFAGLPTGNTYTVTETQAPTGYQIDDQLPDLGHQDAQLVTVSSAGTCESGATPAPVEFADSPLSGFKVTFLPPAAGVTQSQIDCTGTSSDEDGQPDALTPNRDDIEETYSGLADGVYTCTIDVNP